MSNVVSLGGVNIAPATVGLVRNFDHSMSTVLKKLQNLLTLPQGWDGYRGVPVRVDVVYYALSVINTILGNDFDTPSIVPGSTGTVQFEWHYANSDIELLFCNPYELQYYIRVLDEEYEGDVTDHVGTLQSLMAEAFKEAIGAVAAA